jgi:hypothetical protein
VPSSRLSSARRSVSNIAKNGRSTLLHGRLFTLQQSMLIARRKSSPQMCWSRSLPSLGVPRQRKLGAIGLVAASSAATDNNFYPPACNTRVAASLPAPLTDQSVRGNPVRRQRVRHGLRPLLRQQHVGRRAAGAVGIPGHRDRRGRIGARALRRLGDQTARRRIELGRAFF